MPPPTSLAKSSLAVGVATALSRILGFVRDVLIAAMLGAGPAADAFLVAFRLPGIVRRVLGEGGLNAALVPVDQRIRAEEGDAAARRFAGEALVTMALLLLVIVALAEVFAPALVLMMARGYAEDSVRFGLATAYLRLTLPLVAATTLTALAGAVLNTAGRFLAAAFAPVAVNLVLVAVLLALQFSTMEDVRQGAILSVAVSAAGVVQLLVLLPALLSRDVRPLFTWPRLSPPVRRMFALGLPAVATVLAAQLAIIVATQVASHTPASVSRLYYADRVFQLPLGFVSVGMGVVLLPEVARLLRSGALAAVHHAQNRAMEWSLLVALPASVALAVLAKPIVTVLFEHGAFTAQDAAETAAALAALAPGLAAAAVTRVLAQPFFAREAALPPFMAAVVALLMTWVGATALDAPFGVRGIALGITVGAFAGVAVLAGVLAGGDLWRTDARLRARAPRILLASLLMGGALWLAMPHAEAWLSAGRPLLQRVTALAALCLGGFAVYALAAFALRAVTPADWRERG
jgi:putative peptidoglycan lipid II flippase